MEQLRDENAEYGSSELETQPVKKRKGFHSNNNENESEMSSTFRQPAKRLKIAVSDPEDIERNDLGSLLQNELIGDDLWNNENEEDDSNNSDKFYSQIRDKEDTKPELTSEPATPSVKSVSTSITGDNLSKKFDGKGNESRPVHVFMKVTDPETNKLLLDVNAFKSDLYSVHAFLKRNEASFVDSGYAGDISSSLVSLDSFPGLSSLSEDHHLKQSFVPRQMTNSLGSTIPRPSDASSLSRPSVSLGDASDAPAAEIAKPRGRPKKKNPDESLLSSTKIITTSQLKQEKASPPKEKDKEIPKSFSSTGTLTSTSVSESTTTSIDAVQIKIEPGMELETRRRTRGTTRTGTASLKSVDEFNDPGFVKSGTLWGSIGLNEPVFARWRDRSYYSGRITKKGMNDTWRIHFEDDMEDVASESHILPVRILGTGTWTVYCPPEEYKPEDAIIVGHRFIDGTDDDLEKTEYAVVSDVDGGVIFCNRKNLILPEADAKELRKQFQVQQSTPKPGDVSMDNIILGRPRRCGGTSPPPSDMIRKLVAEAEMNDSNSETASVTSNQSNDINLTPISRKPLKIGPKKIVDLSALAGNEVSDTQPTRKTSVEGETTPSQQEGLKSGPIFKGCQFFLTANGDNSGITYDKEECRRLIESNGGQVIDVVGDEDAACCPVYLISNNYARTVKYIHCLAAGIPCISNKWIVDCINNGRITDHDRFTLSAGYSIETESVTTAHNLKPLKGSRIFVTGGSEELYKYWKPVLNAAGAIPVKRSSNKHKNAPPLIPDGTDVVVTDTTCPIEVLVYAKEHDIPIVKPEWLVQTIILGRKVSYDGHEKYLLSDEFE